jgi:hypothetical protein
MKICTTLTVTLILMINGCGDDKKKSKSATSNITVKMQNIDSTAALTLANDSPNPLLTDSQYTTQRSMTPVSFKFPIKRIMFTGNNVVGTVYECAGTTSDECLVDLADKEAVKNLIPKPIAVEYAVDSSPTISGFSVTVDPACDSGSTTSFNVKVKGTISVNGTTYYTTASETGKVMTSLVTNYTSVDVPMSTCTMTWQLPEAIPADKADIVINLFVSTKDVVWANTSRTTTNNACVKASVSADLLNGSFVCAGLAVPFPYVGTADPTIESYKIIENTTGYLGSVHLATYQALPIGAFVRPFFDGSAEGETGCKTGSWLKSIDQVRDGTYSIVIAADGTNNFEMYNAFKLASHTGTCKDFNGNSYGYSAVKL